MKKEELNNLASKALCALVEANGGSIESALDDMRIGDEDERKAIKEWFGWEDEEEYDDDDTYEDEIEFFPGDEGDLDAEDYIEENHLTNVYYEWDEYRKGYALRRED